jgi:hypothetical protein
LLIILLLQVAVLETLVQIKQSVVVAAVLVAFVVQLVLQAVVVPLNLP